MCAWAVIPEPLPFGQGLPKRTFARASKQYSPPGRPPTYSQVQAGQDHVVLKAAPESLALPNLKIC
jgi:hypothetical protein